MIYTLRDTSAKSLAGIAEEKKVRGTDEMFLLFSLGSQFDHKIKLLMEKIGVYCLVADPASISAADVAKIKPIGIVLSGGPASVYDAPPPFDFNIFDLKINILGICLGFQLWAQYVGCKVIRASKREFGVHSFKQFGLANYDFFANCPLEMPVLESHGDCIVEGPAIQVFGSTSNAKVAAAVDSSRHLWGVQFHPEVPETKFGAQILENFCFNICKASDRFPAADKAQQKIAQLREQIGDKRVLLALSGGSDSATTAYLLRYAMAGKKGKLFGVYIKAVDRPDDEAYVRQYFGHEDWIELIIVDATTEVLAALAGKVTMKDKRYGFRDGYKPVLEREGARLEVDFFAQGTLYTDNSESGGGYDIVVEKAQIKLHHNAFLHFSKPEIDPLDDCVKDGGRNIGRAIGVPEELLVRHPFPGPGKVVRIEDEITAPKLAMEDRIDGRYIKDLRAWNLYDTVWQAGAVITKAETSLANLFPLDPLLLQPQWNVVKIEGEVTAEKIPIAHQIQSIYNEELFKWKLNRVVDGFGAVLTKSVTTCTKGDGASSGYVVKLWADKKSASGLAEAAELPWDFLKLVARRLTNEIRDVGAVVYRMSDQKGVSVRGPMIALWSVWSVDGFTARAAELRWDFLKETSRKVIAENPAVGEVVYRISDKPPTTIEWG